jgi:FMN phosphatase YigB (HAD superfamily)
MNAETARHPGAASPATGVVWASLAATTLSGTPSMKIIPQGLRKGGIGVDWVPFLKSGKQFQISSGDPVDHADTNSNVVFLFDVDNTLLNNDHVSRDLKRHLTSKVGEASAQRYWAIFEELRKELGYADYLGALQRYRIERPREPQLLAVSHFMINYPFANRLFPGSLDAVAHAQRLGRAVILSDGDVVFQPRKIERSGLYEMFEGRILIYVHKELELDDVEEKYPASHYVMVDDKVRILAALKKHWGDRVTTVFPRQGHYALDAAEVAKYPKPDITLDRIGELPEAFTERDFGSRREVSA